MNRAIFLIWIFAFVSLPGQQSSKQLLEQARKELYSNTRHATQLAGKSMEMAKDYDGEIAAMIFMINAQMIEGDSRSVIDNALEALDKTRRHQDVNNEIRVLSMLGNQYQSMLMNKEAKTYLDAAENKLNSVKLPDSLLYIKGNLYNVKGIVFRSELNCDFALKYFQKALDVYKNLKQDPTTRANQMLVEIQKGFCLVSEGRNREALQSFRFVLVQQNINIGDNLLFARIGEAQALSQLGEAEASDQILERISEHDLGNSDPETGTLYYYTQMNNKLSEGNISAYLHLLDKYMKSTQRLRQNQDRVIDQMVHDSQVQFSETERHRKTGYILALVLEVVILVSASLFFYRRFSKP